MGRKYLLDTAQHLLSGLCLHWLTQAAVKQLHTQINFQVGNGGTDGGLALAQLASRSGKLAEASGVGKGNECDVRGDADLSNI